MSTFDEFLAVNHNNPIFATAQMALALAAPARGPQDRQPWSRKTALSVASNEAEASGVVWTPESWETVEIAFDVAFRSLTEESYPRGPGATTATAPQKPKGE